MRLYSTARDSGMLDDKGAERKRRSPIGRLGIGTERMGHMFRTGRERARR